MNLGYREWNKGLDKTPCKAPPSTRTLARDNNRSRIAQPCVPRAQPRRSRSRSRRSRSRARAAAVAGLNADANHEGAHLNADDAGEAANANAN